MELRLSCECGREITVTEGSAGAAIQCGCGHNLRVPPFRKPFAMLAQLHDAVAYDRYPPQMLAILLAGIYVLGSIFLGDALLWVASGRFERIGYAVALGGQIWLMFLLVSECHPEAIVWSLLIPFYTWYFAYRRWDIAKWAFVCNVGGLLLILAALMGII
jgi:hypothetical protein